jgi:hypothetical protein
MLEREKGSWTKEIPSNVREKKFQFKEETFMLAFVGTTSKCVFHDYIHDYICSHIYKNNYITGAIMNNTYRNKCN